MVVIKQITVETILQLHDMAIKRYGGSRGILHEGTVHHVVQECSYRYEPIDQAAYLLHGIATKHPFFDGNKRTALLVALATLASQGLGITATNEDVAEFVLLVAQGKKTEEQVRLWLFLHHEKRDGY